MSLRINTNLTETQPASPNRPSTDLHPAKGEQSARHEAFIQTLPVELLLNILGLLHIEWRTTANSSIPDEDKSLSPISPRILASVCSRWRDIIHSVPTFWTCVPIIVDRRQTPLSVIRFYFEASRTLPLNVTMTRRSSSFMEEDSQEKSRVGAVMDLLRPHMSRCESLHIDVIRRSSLPKIRCEDFAIAKELKLKCREDDEMDRPPPNAATRCEFQPSTLEVLHMTFRDFKDACERGVDWFRGVTELSLAHYAPLTREYPRGILTLYRLLGILQTSTPCLRSLALVDMHMPIDIDGYRVQAFHFPSLKRVTLENARGDLIEHLPRALSIPIPVLKLVRCVVDFVHIDPLNARLVLEEIGGEEYLAAFLDNWKGQTIFFQNCPTFHDEFLGWMAQPFVSEAVCHFSCPNLERLGVMKSPNFSVDCLKRVITARREAVIKWHGDVDTKLQFDGNIKRPTSIRKLQYIGNDAPPLSAGDEQWFRDNVEEFGWGTNQVDIDDF
ncbi:hypothetical protein BV22DRAFT_1191240 [Leucogyrophana mollusca]|uniref:Uncharacterized protein n=1 Tax=Leucogyrophana mollusca TaxID=85980 RepID=A0ACB8BYC0_9AGAM|nr:hypothetical protein BV22DRAFT_1191240 [Leucogyrophana mollusca]